MRFAKIITVVALLSTVLFTVSRADKLSVAVSLTTTVPHYNHILVIMEENHGFGQMIGNPNAPIINHLVHTYGLATHYTGVGDPSAPNYVGIIGGSTYGIANDNPYYTHTINQPSLVDQLEGAGLTWKGYFQSMPYPGFKGICYPVKCEGAPDISALYAAKHNGFPYFAHVQKNPKELRKMVPMTQLGQDLQNSQLPNFSFIVPDLCHNMHGAPPFCADDGDPGTVTDNFLVSQGDTYAGGLVNTIIHSPMWLQGNNAVVITWDEGELATSPVATIVITNHGHGACRIALPIITTRCS
jgi:phospholipase C